MCLIDNILEALGEPMIFLMYYSCSNMVDYLLKIYVYPILQEVARQIHLQDLHRLDRRLGGKDEYTLLGRLAWPSYRNTYRSMYHSMYSTY